MKKIIVFFSLLSLLVGCITVFYVSKIYYNKNIDEYALKTTEKEPIEYSIDGVIYTENPYEYDSVKELFKNNLQRVSVTEEYYEENAVRQDFWISEDKKINLICTWDKTGNVICESTEIE